MDYLFLDIFHEDFDIPGLGDFFHDLDNLGIDNILFETTTEGEEEILSPTEDLLGEFDYLFPEGFINLGTMTTESNMNSLNTDPTTDHLASEHNQGNIGISEHSAEIGATVMLNEILERPTSISESFVENNVSVVSVNDLSLEALETSFSSETTFEPSVLSRDDSTSVLSRDDSTSVLSRDDSTSVLSRDDSASVLSRDDSTSTLVLLSSDSPNGVVPKMPQPFPESPVGTNVKPNSRKRQLEKDSSPVPAEGIVPASKEKKGQSCSCTGEETPRVGGPSKEVRLLNQEELKKENEELRAKVQELSAFVKAHENYLPRERPTSIPEGVSVNDLSLEALETSFSSETSFEPSVFSRDDSTSTVVLFSSDSPNGVVPEMPQSLPESPVGTNVKPNSRKRPLEEDSPVPAEGNVPASRKKRVRGPSKKEQEHVLNLKVKKLEKENEELKAKVQELSASVEFLRKYIVSKLKG